MFFAAPNNAPYRARVMPQTCVYMREKTFVLYFCEAKNNGQNDFSGNFVDFWEIRKINILDYNQYNKFNNKNFEIEIKLRNNGFQFY